MDNRKEGVVTGFENCSDEYLGLVNEDLELGLTLPEMQRIRFMQRKLLFAPTVAGLYFYAEYIKNSRKKADGCIIAGVSSDTPGLTELFSKFVSETSDSGIRSAGGVSLTGAAYAAAVKGANTGDCSFEISRSENPVFPCLGKPSETVCSNGFTVRYGEKRPYIMSDAYNSGVLILPPDGCDKNYFIDMGERLLEKIAEQTRHFCVFPCTEAGLAADIMENVGPCIIYTKCLPYHRDEPVAAAADYSPGFVIMAPSRSVKFICDTAAAAGFVVSNPIARLSQEKQCLTLIFSGGQMQLTAEMFDILKDRRFVSVKNAGEPVLNGRGECEVFSSCLDADVCAYELSGNIYDSLCKHITGKGTYCLAGTVAPGAPETVGVIAALHSFVKNSDPRFAGAYFKAGEKTSLTLFCFGTGRGQNKKEPIPQSGRADMLFCARAQSEIKEKGQDTEMRVFDNLSEICGNTPLLRLFPNAPAKVYAKLEMFNPAGSAKDRVALQIIKDAENAGILKAGGTIIEATSGNTGIGLACYGVARGYRVVIVMPDTMSRERIDLIKAYGAEIVLTPGALGMKGSTAEAEKIRAATEGSFIAGQFDNPSNPKAHELTTGPEIWRDTDGTVDFFVAGIGTGGTLCGSAAYLKKMKPEVKAIGCEPASSPLITKGTAGPHKIQGIGANFIPGNFNPSVVDGMFTVADEEALGMTKELARSTGLLCGISAGCAAFAAKKLAYMPENAGKTIVVLLPDTGEHYLSTGVFTS